MRNRRETPPNSAILLDTATVDNNLLKPTILLFETSPDFKRMLQEVAL
jgi:hypothetical protein